MRVDALMKGFEKWREDERQRNFKVMRTYEGSASYQEYQRREHVKKLLCVIPKMSESKVVERINAADFKELPEALQHALVDRMLQLELGNSTNRH